MSTDALVADLRRRAGEGPLVVVGVGSGLTARGATQGGADLLACYSTATYRVMGLPSALAFLPYDDANARTLAALPEVVAASSRPVIAGLGAHDPRRPVARLIEQVASLGAVGVTNEPFIGMYEGDLRAQLEAAGLGFARELELIATAAAMGLLGFGWAWSPEDARQMVAAGAQTVGAMLGVTAGGTAGSEPASPLDEGIRVLTEIVDAARDAGPEVLVLIHGGALNDPAAVATALERTGADGYVGGSTIERVPVVSAVAEAVSAYKEGS